MAAPAGSCEPSLARPVRWPPVLFSYADSAAPRILRGRNLEPRKSSPACPAGRTSSLRPDGSEAIPEDVSSRCRTSRRRFTWFQIPTRRIRGARYPHKKTKRVANGLAGQGSVRNFLRGLPFVFQRGRSEGLNATYHFTFTGQEELKATVVIQNKTLQVQKATPALQICASLRIAKRGSASCARKPISSGPCSGERFESRIAPALAGLQPLLPVVAIGAANGSI